MNYVYEIRNIVHFIGLVNLACLPRCYVSLRAFQSQGPGCRGAALRRWTVFARFAVQFIERIENLFEDLVPSSGEAVHPCRFGPFRLCRAQPAALGHSRQHGIQRSRTQAITVMVQLFQHPLTIDALFSGVVEDMNLPEG